MAISTYAELKSAIADWLDREDLTGRIEDFIVLAEASLATRLGIRTAEAEVELTGIAGVRSIALPAGYRDAKALWLVRDDGREELRFEPAELMTISPATGQPVAWCVDGATIAFDRPLDRPYGFTLRMVSALALDGATATNLTLANYPNLYLFGALREAGAFLRDAELTATFEAKYAEALAEAKDLESRAGRRVTLSTEIGMLGRDSQALAGGG